MNIGHLCVCPSVCLSYVCPYFHFRMITFVESWFGSVDGQILWIFDRLICSPHNSAVYYRFKFFIVFFQRKQGVSFYVTCRQFTWNIKSYYFLCEIIIKKSSVSQSVHIKSSVPQYWVVNALYLACWVKFLADDVLDFFSHFFFPENRIWHFMQIVSIGDNLHEVSNPVFFFFFLFLGK